MLIRRYETEDLEELLDIWMKASLAAHSFIPVDILKSTQQLIRDKYLGISESWVVVEDGAIVAFMSLVDHYIGGLFVLPGKQGQGYGRALIDKAKKEKHSLTLGVYEKNKKAFEFYQNCGFVCQDRELQEETNETVLKMSFSE